VTIGFAATVLVFGLALWLGLYLIGRDPRAPRLLLTGSGLLAYALAVACDLLSGAAPEGVGFVLERGRLLLLLLPVVLWTGAMIQLLPEETPARDRLARVWGVAAPLFAVMLVLASFGSGVAMGAANDVESVMGAVVLAPMLAVGGFAAWTLRRRRLRQVVGVLAVFTLFFALSTGLILFPPGWLPRSWVVLALGVDLISLGLAIAYFDAFDLGEALLPDTIRSFDAAALATLLFGGQVALVMALTTGPTFPMMSLLLGTTATAIAVTTLSDPVGAALDKLALGRLPLARQARSELRRTSRALPRANLELDPAALDEQEFARLTRRALSNFGDLPRLSASPLANLPLVASRIAARGARDDAIERAAELKTVLAESIGRLKPRADVEFGTSDEWRYYNALHFPYVVGLKPYSTRDKTKPKDPASREALEWFRASVPERTLRNWQNAAARFVARDLRSRDGSISG
jgi:hypothetical protein